VGLANYPFSIRPILIAEISLPRQRGRLLSLQQWMITWGVCELLPVDYIYIATNIKPDPDYVLYQLRSFVHERQRFLSPSLGNTDGPRNDSHVLLAHDAPFAPLARFEG
jgi:hypothetical protein